MPTFLPSEFMQKTDNLGSLARKNKFTVEIISPKALTTGLSAHAQSKAQAVSGSVNPDKIEFLASAASLPGKSYATTTHRMYGFGLQVPYEAAYEPVSITFLNTNDYSPRTFFEDWMANIARIGSYNMHYYKDFISTVKIHAYDDQDRKRYSCELVESYPKSMSAIEMGWDGVEVQTFTVDIMYSWWISNRQSEGTWKGPSMPPDIVTNQRT
jgi:hypothetical protein